MTALRDLIRTALKLPDGSVRFSNEPFPTGLNAYVTLEHSWDEKLSYTRRYWDSVTETSRMLTSQLGRVTVNAYGIGSFRLLTKLKVLLSAEPMVKSRLKILKLGVLKQSDVRNISALAGPGFEERAVFDIELTYAHIVRTSTKRVEVATVQIHDEQQLRQIVVRKNR